MTAVVLGLLAAAITGTLIVVKTVAAVSRLACIQQTNIMVGPARATAVRSVCFIVLESTVGELVVLPTFSEAVVHFKQLPEPLVADRTPAARLPGRSAWATLPVATFVVAIFLAAPGPSWSTGTCPGLSWGLEE